jgi:hypothetical protein
VVGKYDDLLFEMFAEVFNHLPLFAIIQNQVNNNNNIYYYYYYYYHIIIYSHNRYL